MFYHDKKDKIMKQARMVSSDDSRSQAFLGALQNATSHFWKKLTDEEIVKYELMAKDWSLNGPPSHIQARWDMPHILIYVSTDLTFQNGFCAHMWVYSSGLPDPAV